MRKTKQSGPGRTRDCVVKWPGNREAVAAARSTAMRPLKANRTSFGNAYRKIVEQAGREALAAEPNCPCGRMATQWHARKAANQIICLCDECHAFVSFNADGYKLTDAEADRKLLEIQVSAR